MKNLMPHAAAGSRSAASDAQPHPPRGGARESAGRLAPWPAADLPVETDDPRNGLLDAFEQFVEAIVANGMEAQLRARMARLLPCAPVAHPQPRAAGGGTEPAAKSGAQQAFAAAGPLGLTALLAELKRLEKLKMNALAHQAVQAVKGQAQSALDQMFADGKGDQDARP